MCWTGQELVLLESDLSIGYMGSANSEVLYKIFRGNKVKPRPPPSPSHFEWREPRFPKGPPLPFSAGGGGGRIL
jgi:hypothetical protein